MHIRIKLLLTFLICSLTPLFLILFSTFFFRENSADWLMKVFIFVAVASVFFSFVFMIVTELYIIEPSYKKTETAMSSAMNELKVATEKIQLEMSQDEALLNNIGDAVVAVDRQRKVIFINDVAAGMIGWKREEVVGHEWGTDMPGVVDENGNSIPRAERSIHQAWMTRGRAHVGYYYYLRKDGSRFPVSITSAPIITNNIVTGAIVVFRDITREREIDRMKTEFISLASHQLRTPLSAIKWYLRMLIDGDAGALNKEQSDFIHIIDESNERMITLVNDLLNISRIESGRIIIEPNPTDIKDLVEDIVKEISMKLHEKEQFFTMNIEEGLPSISIDGQLIRNVYLNLLSNAVKYTPQRGVISIKVYKQGESVVSQITDNGYGIPKGQQNKIFQKFFRAENVVRYETDGTGLGLYLAKAIVDSSHGRIWFDSIEGKGTTFYFSLPLAGVEAKKGEVTLET